ncbi:MAG: thymidine phosphorylase [Candidatus Scalinduaceae bacterium]
MYGKDIIRKKREGYELSKDEISFLIQGYVKADIPDYQIAAFLMSVYVQGLTTRETVFLTEELIASGKVIDLGSIPGKKIDKHSTGGVGDKVSLVLAPLVAALGVKVPMISGRSLGHTGGTLDKLESIKGFQTDLTIHKFIKNVREVGVCIIGQTEELTPADRKLYSLRDATSTVESIPLIASSIMSKKIASGVDGLLLDVKTGNGAFLKEHNQSICLAKQMIEIGKEMQKDVVAIITDMNQPLGKMVGNATEVVESIETLKGEGPEDLVELTVTIGSHMLMLAEICNNLDEGREMLLKTLKNGKAYEKFVEMVIQQGGNEGYLLDMKNKAISKKTREVLATNDGYVSNIDTYKMGTAAWVLGAGRDKINDKIDHSVGYEVLAKRGDRVELKQPLVRISYNDEKKCIQAEALIKEAYKITNSPSHLPPLIYEVLDN